VNVLSGVRLVRHYLPSMLAKNWGRIIFISSESAQHIPAEMIHYGMTKTAQVSIARGLAESLGEFHPGGTHRVGGCRAVVGRMAEEQGVTPAEIEKQFFASVRPTSLLKRFETPEEVTAVVAFVASTPAVTINGAAVRAEGGVVRSIL
jgi:NAD(P)-dependent dehydrogenase (short-subunit alcohol dehydrogenase family)